MNEGRDEGADATEVKTTERDGGELTGTTAATPSDIGLEAGRVEEIRIEDINLEDETYKFRAALRVGPLKDSLQSQGQQVPIMVRRKQGQRKYQLISGFRRVTAASQLGWETIAGIVRNGLSDEEAFRVSVLENTARKTYSDIDRAYVMKAYEQRGYSSADIGGLMGLTKRQVNNIKSLLELPKEVQAAIDDEGQAFSTTHALTLKKLKKKYPKLDYRTWIRKVNDENLSVQGLIRAVNDANKGRVAKGGFKSLFRDDGTDFKSGAVRLRPVKFNVKDLGDEDRDHLRTELNQLLKLLDINS
jgi:ParB/RepB/Spo0J family partition protein